ncbi:MAG: right-handed parallel beta-helix repeat-containing protein [Verrucomicrobiales bacterium]|nr:right-handed parallel beta-helix repeat-containing protein [Verrucomicrobiales bacterium]
MAKIVLHVEVVGSKKVAEALSPRQEICVISKCEGILYDPGMNIRIVSLLPALFPISLFAQDNTPKPDPVTIDAAKFETLQAAFDAVPESGGLVRLPAGTVEITEPLVVRTPETRIEGAGASTHIKNLNEAGKPALILEPTGYAENPKLRMWRVQLGNFRISGNEKSGDGVHANGIQEIFIHGLSVDHHGGHGISLVNCYEDPRVSDSILTYNKKAGLFIDSGHDIVVNANHFEENQDAVFCTNGFNLCMNGNNLDDHLGNGVVIENTYGSVVSGNMIEECNGTAIILDRDCYGITLSANVIAHDMEGGIDLRDAHGCAVSANTFTLVHRHSVRVGPESGRITITGNSFSNSHIGNGKLKRPAEHERPISRDMGTGVVIEGASLITISGNSFTGIEAEAVKADAKSGKILVQGNLVSDWGRVKKDAKAFDLPEGNGVVVGQNLVDETEKEGE